MSQQLPCFPVTGIIPDVVWWDQSERDEGLQAENMEEAETKEERKRERRGEIERERGREERKTNLASRREAGFDCSSLPLCIG